MGRPAGVDGVSLRVDLDELHATRDDARGVCPFLDGVIDNEHHLRGDAHITRVHQYRPLLELVAVSFQHKVGDRLHQGVTGMDEAGHRGADTVGQPHVLLLEADALVAA